MRFKAFRDGVGAQQEMLMPGLRSSAATKIAVAAGVGLAVGVLIGSQMHSHSPATTGGLWFGSTAIAEVRAPDLASDAATANWLTQGSNVMARVSKLVAPSVVHIEAERRTASRGVVEETGSGVIMENADFPGYFVVTNRHVVIDSKPSDIHVILADGRFFTPTKVLSDKESDVAVLVLDAKNLQPARWGDSKEVEIGHMVLAMGSPFGLSNSTTFGIISAKGRRALNLGDTRTDVINQDFLQTDAAINPGNSGGPLVNLKGEIIGLNTAIASSGGGNEGIGFSIPSNLVSRVVADLLKNGRVARAYLGVNLTREFDWKMAKNLSVDRVRGAHVNGVEGNTPAAKAGIKVNDVVVTFDGVEVEDQSHLIHLVSLEPIGKKVKLVVLRKGSYVTLEMDLIDRELYNRRAEQPTRPDMGYRVDRLGLELHSLDENVIRQLGFTDGTQGVLVLKVDADGPAAGEIKVYDVIEEISQVPVADVQDVRRILSEPRKESLVLKIRRFNRKGGSEAMSVEIE